MALIKSRLVLDTDRAIAALDWEWIAIKVVTSNEGDRDLCGMNEAIASGIRI